MTYRLIISDRAQAQLRKGANWYLVESQSQAVADKWYNGFLDALSGLRENPLGCGLAHESDRFPFELREMLYGSGRRKTHRALFRVHGTSVEVISIRHTSQRDVTPEDL